ncbi:MAG: outer membrane lipoprotein-sorting protein [Flavobacteriaceae bacterium]|nr:outer membrane lipoprotein-sorting protein [Flavobacteriaceae bacterium]
MKKLPLLLFVFIASFTINAQTADEIINTYFENIGGVENFKKLEGFKITAEINQGMVIPIDIIKLKDGKEAVIVNIQGKELKQNVFDGKTLWNTNFTTMKAEKATAEATANHKLAIKDFPDPFIDYKEKGYSIELMGKETIDGAETFKIKFTQTPMTIDDAKVPNISYYFFDTENFVPIAMQKEILFGQGKGMVSETKFSDYQEIDGLYFPFSMTQGVKGKAGGQPITITKIELNPKVKADIFTFPKVIEETTPDSKPQSQKKEDTHKH